MLAIVVETGSSLDQIILFDVLKNILELVQKLIKVHQK